MTTTSIHRRNFYRWCHGSDTPDQLEPDEIFGFLDDLSAGDLLAFNKQFSHDLTLDELWSLSAWLYKHESQTSPMDEDV